MSDTVCHPVLNLQIHPGFQNHLDHIHLPHLSGDMECSLSHLSVEWIKKNTETHECNDKYLFTNEGWIDTAHGLLRLDHSQPQARCGLLEYDSSSPLDGMECAYAETINQSINQSWWFNLAFVYLFLIWNIRSCNEGNIRCMLKFIYTHTHC